MQYLQAHNCYSYTLVNITTEEHQYNSSQSKHNTEKSLKTMLTGYLEQLYVTTTDTDDQISVQSDVPSRDSEGQYNMAEIRDFLHKISLILSIVDQLITRFRVYVKSHWL